MSFQDLPGELVMILDPLLDPLTRQVLAMTCTCARKYLGRLSSRILAAMPEAWKPWQFDHDPCGDYYYPLLYRAVREAPLWLRSWTMGTSKAIYRARMVLKLIWSPSHKKDTPYTSFVFYRLINGCRGWKFSASWQSLTPSSLDS